MTDKHYGDPTAGSTMYVGLVGTIIFVLTIIYLQALYYNAEEQSRIEKVIEAPVPALENNRAQQKAWLTRPSYEHVYNNNAGRVTIPIDEAADKLLAEWGQRTGATGQ